jgi:hypothetical protein
MDALPAGFFPLLDDMFLELGLQDLHLVQELAGTGQQFHVPMPLEPLKQLAVTLKPVAALRRVPFGLLQVRFRGW